MRRPLGVAAVSLLWLSGAAAATSETVSCSSVVLAVGGCASRADDGALNLRAMCPLECAAQVQHRRAQAADAANASSAANVTVLANGTVIGPDGLPLRGKME